MRRTTTTLIILGILGLVVGWRRRRDRPNKDARVGRSDPIAECSAGVAVLDPQSGVMSTGQTVLGHRSTMAGPPTGNPNTTGIALHTYDGDFLDLPDVDVSLEPSQSQKPQEESSLRQMSPPAETPKTDGDFSGGVADTKESLASGPGAGELPVPAWPHSRSPAADESPSPSSGEPPSPNALNSPTNASQVTDGYGDRPAAKASSYPTSLPKKRIDPGKRGGRHRVTQNTLALYPKRPLPRRFELECERHGMAWRIIVRLGSGSGHLRAYQGDRELARTPDDAWVVVDLVAPVRVGDRLYSLPSRQDFWVFRIGEDGHGRAVLNPGGRGTYLVVVPQEWKIGDSDSRLPRQSLGVVGWSGYVCETLEGLRAIDDHGRTMVDFHQEAFEVEFTGNDISEFEGPGPLFVGSPPEVSAPWQMVSQVVVGREDQAVRPWREMQKISGGRWPGFPTLPSHAGWYFVRFLTRRRIYSIAEVFSSLRV